MTHKTLICTLLCLPWLPAGCSEPEQGSVGEESETNDAGDTDDGPGGTDDVPDDTDSTGPDSGPDSGPDTGSDTDGPTGYCGNGMLEGDEVCDDGMVDGEYGHCLPDCSGLGPHCGDGAIQGDEVCDDGENTGEAGACLPDCSGVVGVCGDGQVDGDEPCDDGNDQDADGCNTDCQLSGSVEWDHRFDGPHDDSNETPSALVWTPDGAYAVIEHRADGQGRDVHIVTFDPHGTVVADVVHDPYGIDVGIADAIALPEGGIMGVGWLETPGNLIVGTTFVMANPYAEPNDEAFVGGGGEIYAVGADPISGHRIMSGLTSNGGPVIRILSANGDLIDEIDGLWFAVTEIAVMPNQDLLLGVWAEQVWLSRNAPNLDHLQAYQREEDGELWITNDMKVGPDGLIYVAGHVQYSQSGLDRRPMLLALDADMELRWEQVVELDDEGAGSWDTVAVTEQGHVVLGGFHQVASTRQGRVRKLDADGNELWTTMFEDNHADVTDVAVDEDGAVYTLHRDINTAIDGNTDVIVTKLRP